jgi:hypothetical protein
MSADNPQLTHLLKIGRQARAQGYAGLATGEQLCAALALNRFDWLQELDYTIAEAIDLVGPTWIAQIPEAALVLFNDTRP